ncbi:MAG: hypothetical protein M3Z24_09190 [Chloroflexota bacterium]|nr:hypothetical protein [Chloroflexota bacterium]
MPDSENQYPYHQGEPDEQPQQQHKHHLHPMEEEEVQPSRREREEEEYVERPQRRGIRQREEVITPQLPERRFKNALIAGLIAGIIAAIVSIIIAIANSGAYQQAADYVAKKGGGSVPVDLAFKIAGFAFLSWVIAAIVFVIAGFAVGKISVHRRLGFLAGFVGGIVYYGISVITSYIPSYPGNAHTANSMNAGLVLGGIGVTLLIFAIWGVIGGLFSVLGSWIATRRHPYYIGY